MTKVNCTVRKIPDYFPTAEEMRLYHEGRTIKDNYAALEEILELMRDSDSEQIVYEKPINNFIRDYLVKRGYSVERVFTKMVYIIRW